MYTSMSSTYGGLKPITFGEMTIAYKFLLFGAAFITATGTAFAEGPIGTTGGPDVPFNGCIAYEHRDFRGAKFSFRGNVNIKYVGGRWNDKVSSFACHSGCTMTIYKDRDFKGARASWGTTQYVGDEWNDSISSLIVHCER
jgi:Peptidase inhibitor family I36